MTAAYTVVTPFIDDIIIRTNLNLKKKHKFINIGCGVGNVLLQVVGETCADSCIMGNRTMT